MGDYYNATRGPLSASLTDGSALSIGPKRWIFISPENESSASIISLLEKGFLKRATVARSAPPASTPVADLAAVPEATPTPTAEKEAVSDASASTSSMKEEIFRKKK